MVNTWKQWSTPMLSSTLLTSCRVPAAPAPPEPGSSSWQPPFDGDDDEGDQGAVDGDGDNDGDDGNDDEDDNEDGDAAAENHSNHNRNEH